MDSDDLDIYEDLDTFQKEEEKKTAELLSLEAKYNDSMKTIETLQSENADLKKKIRRIGINFQNLLDTAKAEIKRKDKQIEQLRKEKDDICFRRKQPRREYTVVATMSENKNTRFKNESNLPDHDFGANTNGSAHIISKKVEVIENEHLSTTSHIARGREITLIRDEYKKNERRNESFQPRHDCDPQREKYNISNNQRDKHESRYKARSRERDGSVRSATRDYSRSYDSRTADRSHRDERDIKNKLYKTEKIKDTYNSTENGRRKHSYDSDRSRYHGKEEKNKSESYDGHHDRRSDSKEVKTNSDSSDGRYDRRSDSMKHRQDANKKSKETSERVRDKVNNLNRNESATDAKNSDDLTESKVIRGKPSNNSESSGENKLNKNYEFSERPHKGTKSIETVKAVVFLGNNLSASKDSQRFEKLLAEEKLTKEKLLALENEFPCKEIDNANHLTPADGTMTEKTALFDKLFESTPINAGDVNSNTLSKVIEFPNGSSSLATTFPSNDTDTSESTTISSTINHKTTELKEYYLPICFNLSVPKGEQNKLNKNDASVVVKSDTRYFKGTPSNVGLTIGAKPKQLISSATNKNQAADENSTKKTNVNANKEMVDYAKIAKTILSEDEEQIEFEQTGKKMDEDERVNNETKTNGNNMNGIQILENVRLPNIYEIRAQQRRQREAAVARKARRAMTAETNDIKQNATQNVSKMDAPVPEYYTKGLQKNSTNAAENDKDVDLQEESVEAKINRYKNAHDNSPQISSGISAGANAITLNNETTIKVNSSEITNTADQQSIENVKLLDKNITSPLEAIEITEAAGNNTVADDVALKQKKSDASCINRQNESETFTRSNNADEAEDIPNVGETDDIKSKQKINILCQKSTQKNILDKIITNVLDTVEILIEDANILKRAKSGQPTTETNIISSVSPTPDVLNEKDQSNFLSFTSSTEGRRTFTNKESNSNLLTKVMPDHSERNKSMDLTNKDNKENTVKSQTLYESKEEVSQSSKKSEKSTCVVAVEEESAQLKASGENTKSLLDNSSVNVEDKESCEQNVIAQQEAIAELERADAELKKGDEQRVDITQEANVHESIKPLESVNTANESTTEVKVVSENSGGNCDMVLSKEKRVGNGRERHYIIIEQKTVERNVIAKQKAATDSAVDESEVLLESTDTTNESSRTTETCITKNSEVNVPDATKSIMNDTERKSECSTNVELMSNGDNSFINKRNLSAMAESGNGPVIEGSEITKCNGISEETTIVESTNVVNGSEVRKKEATMSYLIDGVDKPINSYIDENVKVTEVPNVPNIEPKSVVESKKLEIYPKIVQGFAGDCHRSKNSKTKAKELSNPVNISTEGNMLIEKMKRAEVLWKFKIPKLPTKRKREDSEDTANGSCSKGIKNTGTDAVKREKVCIKTEEPINSHKKKKNAKLMSKQIQKGTNVHEINANIKKNLLETKTLFEDQKKSKRIIEEIDNWARRKVGETTAILETETQIECMQAHKISTNKHETMENPMSNMHSKDEITVNIRVLNKHMKQKTDKHKPHRDKNSASSSTDSKCVNEKQQDYYKTATEETSTRERCCDKDDQAQERRKSHPKVEDNEHSQDTKPRNVKCGLEIHKEKSQTNDGKDIKCGQKLVPKAQRSELQNQKLKSLETEIDIAKKVLECRELEEKCKNCSTTENITSKSQVEVAAVSCEIKIVKCDFSKNSLENTTQKREGSQNNVVAKRKSAQKIEKEVGRHEKRAKSDVGVCKNENVQELSKVSSTEGIQVATQAHDSLKAIINCARTIASESNTYTTNDNHRTTSTYAQRPMRSGTVADTSTSCAVSEVISKSHRRKRCKMHIEDSDDEDVSQSMLTLMSDPPESHDVKHVDLEQENKDIIDILQNDKANDSNENLPAPQTPTSLPMNISQDAKYEEIDSRLQLMFASPKSAEKTSTTNSLAVDNQNKTRLLQPILKHSSVATDVTVTDVPPDIGLLVTKALIGGTKGPADFNITDTFLNDISANSFLASDMNATIDETNHSGVNANSSLNDSNVSTKHISLGSSNYRFEKISENEVNLFITRKRRGKRKPTAKITTNTESAT